MRWTTGWSYRRLADARPDAFLPALASSLNNLSNRLGELGRREEGLEAITEAVQIRRQLAQARPEVYREELRRSEEVQKLLEALRDQQ
ncbi:hypothetical protein [Actinoallomurus sp. NPDC050550]|uniref:hypothetical protein n=1 Tax=Actinoallomurus sp. NPDC050550 TaxID=3154937 RepID=UPI0033DAF82D